MTDNPAEQGVEGENLKEFTPEQQKIIDAAIQSRINKVKEAKDLEIKELKTKLKDVPEDFNANLWKKIPKDFDPSVLEKLKQPPEPKTGDDKFDSLRIEQEKLLEELKTAKLELEKERQQFKSEALNNQLKSLGVDDKHLKFVGSELPTIQKDHPELSLEKAVEKILTDNGLAKLPAKGNGGKYFGNAPTNMKPKSLADAILLKMEENSK
jgi:hypothetical protein